MNNRYSFIIFQLFLTILISVNCFYSDEKLEIYQLKVPKKLLYHFTTEIKQIYNKQEQISFNNIFPRSIYDQIFNNANVSQVRISLGSGHVNEQYFNQDQYSEFNFNFPKQGSSIEIDQYADFHKALMFISEIIGVSIFIFENQNSFLYSLNSKNKNIQFHQNQKDEEEKNFIWGMNPQESFCSDNIIRFFAFLPCNGQKGVFSIIDAYTVFRAEYISMQLFMSYDSKNNIALTHFEMNIIFDTSKRSKEQIFKLNENIQSCPKYNLSSIQCMNCQESESDIDISQIDLQNAQIFPINYIPNPKKIQKSSNEQQIIRQIQYITGEWWSFKGEVVSEFENLNSKIDLILSYQLYLPYYIIPNIFKSRIILNQDQNIIENNELVQLEIDKAINDKYLVLKFFIKLGAGNNIKVIIDIERLLKSFEDYPHDPQVGNYIPSTPLFYQQIGKSKIYKQYTTSLIIKIPNPDFSMPFNVITFSMVVIGYFYITIYNLAVEKEEENKQQKQPFIKKIIEKIELLIQKLIGNRKKNIQQQEKSN